MWRNRHRSLRMVSGLPGHPWLPLFICVLFFLNVAVLVPVHQCVHHNSVLGLIGTCNCPCHSLTTGWHEGTSVILLVGPAANALLPHIDVGILPVQILEYHPALQRAPPLLTA
jgi:hypothetical protein